MKFLYINTGNKYAPDKHLIDGLRENSHEVFELIENGHGISKYVYFINRFLKNKNQFDVIIIGYGLPFLIPVIRLLSIKKLIFNAISSQYEANIISRNIAKNFSFTGIRWFLVDLISFHLSSKVLLESNAQVSFVNKKFFVPKNKLILGRMGVDEEIFFRDQSIQKNKDFTVLFRGRFLPESGILTVIETAKKLEDKKIKFLVIGHGFMYREVNALIAKLKPTNLKILSERLSEDELRKMMLSCHISLGQLADHPRLIRTLPAKLYESLALGLPYLTGRNAGVLEVLTENNNCIAVEPGNSLELAEKITYLQDNPEILSNIGENGYNLYLKEFTSKKLAKDFIRDCFGYKLS
ncbi:MAG: group 1 glycosyl transferase [Parcubacteria group bacterium LiPW_30]|nr:MAG: group 1 glycosyl transferase [Parcubacteria group bacterium LiPW_30]